MYKRQVPTNALGVPNAGVTNVGEVPNTNAPVPVSSEITLAKLADDPAANPVAIGKPVALVNTPLAGVPKAGVVKTGLVKVLFVKVCEAVNCTISLFVIDAILVAVSAFPVNGPTKPVAVTLPMLPLIVTSPLPPPIDILPSNLEFPGL